MHRSGGAGGLSEPAPAAPRDSGLGGIRLFRARRRFRSSRARTIKIPTGICAEIAEGWVLQIYPRSGLGFQYGLQLDNTVGIIDSDYYHAKNGGHIFIKMTNCSRLGQTVSVGAGEGFAQGHFPALRRHGG